MQLVGLHAPVGDEIEPPPSDVLGCANWLYRLLCHELHRTMGDEALSEAQRRTEVLKFAAKITAATPNQEIFEMREKMKAEEKRKKGRTLGGKTERAEAGFSGAVRASAPRGRA